VIKTWMKLIGNTEHMGNVRSLFRTSIGKRSGLFDRSKYET